MGLSSVLVRWWVQRLTLGGRLDVIFFVEPCRCMYVSNYGNDIIKFCVMF